MNTGYVPVQEDNHGMQSSAEFLYLDWNQKRPGAARLGRLFVKLVAVCFLEWIIVSFSKGVTYVKNQPTGSCLQTVEETGKLYTCFKG